jgi:two-component system chemotaxis response regulator CheY
MKALIVDDSRVLRTHLGRIMRAMGWQTAETEDGSQALAALRAESEFDLALIDMNMPVMNGSECVRRIRSELPMHRVKVIMVTTEVDFPLIHELLRNGADEFLMKPFTPDNLRNKLELLSLPSSGANDSTIDSFPGV